MTFLDKALIANVPSFREGLNKKLEEVNESEENLLFSTVNKKRSGYALNADLQIKQKVLRLFIRDIYYSGTETEKAHFILSIEGTILNQDYMHIRLGSLFDTCKFIVEVKEKKNLYGPPQIFEYSEETFPSGGNASSFQIKIPSDGKGAFTKIYLTRNEDVQKRFDLSDKLRNVLQHMRVDPSEEEVWYTVCR